MTADEYCRALESYLTRKNDGHLIRIVGPAFERVRGWADQGIPLKIAQQGIDRCFERYYAKGPRRRPVRVEFCEADILDAFDAWRRAVGVSSEAAGGEASGGRQRESLATHIERAIARLTTLRGRAPAAGGDDAVAVPDAELDHVIRALDDCRSRAGHARGQARQLMLDELDALDARLLAAARAAASTAVRAEVSRQAEQELQPFRDRMPQDAWEQARLAAEARALRDRARLPLLSPE